MYYIYNVVKYLNGDIYNDATIIDDIEKTILEFKKSSNNNLIQMFMNSMNRYLYMTRISIIKFADILLSDGYPYQYQLIQEYYHFPFRYSRNPMADKRLLELIYNKYNLRIDDAVMYLLAGIDDSKYNSREFLDRLNWFFNYDPISFESINKGKGLGHIGYMPKSMNKIELDYQDHLNGNSTLDEYKVIANYGELEFYKYMIKRITAKDDFVWVSFYLGDGLGYDFALYDKKQNKLTLYEVKTTDNENNFMNVSLTSYENIIRESVNDSLNTEYHVIKILLGEESLLYDINCNTNDIKCLTSTGKQKSLVKLGKEYRII